MVLVSPGLAGVSGPGVARVGVHKDGRWTHTFVDASLVPAAPVHVLRFGWWQLDRNESLDLFSRVRFPIQDLTSVRLGDRLLACSLSRLISGVDLVSRTC